MAVFAIDYSGSIDYDLAFKAAEAIEKVGDQGDQAITFDHQIVGVDSASNARSLINNSGGGGSSLQAVMDWANGHGHKNVTVYTDGQFWTGNLKTYDLRVCVILMGEEDNINENCGLPVVGRLIK